MVLLSFGGSNDIVHVQCCKDSCRQVGVFPPQLTTGPPTQNWQLDGYLLEGSFLELMHLKRVRKSVFSRLALSPKHVRNGCSWISKQCNPNFFFLRFVIAFFFCCANLLNNANCWKMPDLHCSNLCFKIEFVTPTLHRHPWWLPSVIQPDGRQV